MTLSAMMKEYGGTIFGRVLGAAGGHSRRSREMHLASSSLPPHASVVASSENTPPHASLVTIKLFAQPRRKPARPPHLFRRHV